ncbi:Uma2 family endonuclease [Embleya sp. NBC_00888]|uniref:Uma2 family endonuclease n=1 Tax=Embleya sp. NBC_00888 TaxID=2975960 RepID=UPI003865534F|nr:Uma2 family endonuclease [Embleya sp. NBC_00888]
MSAMAHEIPAQEDVVLDGFLALDTPLGFRAELIEGEIVVTPPPMGDHERIVSAVVRQIIGGSAAAMDFSGGKGLVVAGHAELPSNHVIPDGTFAPEELDLFLDAESWMPCDGVALVLEVTSQRADVDREQKRRAYARSAIPLYLLVDREHGKVTLFSAPKGDDYTESYTCPFGKQIDLPAPFSTVLDTTRFV